MTEPEEPVVPVEVYRDWTRPVIDPPVDSVPMLTWAEMTQDMSPLPKDTHLLYENVPVPPPEGSEHVPGGYFRTETLPVDTWARHDYVTRGHLDDAPALRATMTDSLWMLAETLRGEGKRFVGDPSFSVAEQWRAPVPIPDPWWRKVLVALRLRRRRYRDLPPLYVLRAEVRAA